MNNTIGFLEPFLKSYVAFLYVDSPYWTAFGVFGNLMFSSRFLIQWYYSEKEKRVVVPAVFWQISFWGSLIALVYAFHIDKAPVILGSIFLPFLYARNLFILKKSG